MKLEELVGKNDLIVRGSEYQDFLTCKKRWYHAWYEGIEPKRPDNKLFFGTLFHKWLEFYYEKNCIKIQADIALDQWLSEQDTGGMEQPELDDMIELFNGVSRNYHKKYGEQDKHINVLGTEIEVLIYLGDSIWFNGTIDLIYELDGKIRFADHKTISSISSYIEKSKMDRQISRYWWALEQLSEGFGYIKHENEVDWVEWDEIKGKEIAGFDYNLIAKDYPKEPKVLKLKKGQKIPDISQDKSQKTTYDLYLAKIHELGHNEVDYADMLELLKNKPDQFLHREDVKRGQSELQAAIWEFFYTAKDIATTRDLLDTGIGAENEHCYRNIGEHCTYMCNFKTLCETDIQGGNVSLAKTMAYKVNKDRVTVAGEDV